MVTKIHANLMLVFNSKIYFGLIGKIVLKENLDAKHVIPCMGLKTPSK